MHKKRFWITSCILAAGFTMNMAGAVGAADAENGELIFAQCEEYINVRSEADENSEVVAKLYNDGSATVEETEDNGWYKIRSGNAEGYVKAEYFATGEQAKEIADQVGFFDVKYFSIQFKKETGLTPSAFRTLNGNED